MASIALGSAYRRISVREFLEMVFGDARAELDDGIIYMMAGGSEQHARITANILIFLGPRLHGSGWRAYCSDFAAQTGEATVRLPDVSVQGRVRSAVPSTASLDQKAKLEEYR